MLEDKKALSVIFVALKEDFLEDALYEDIDDLKEELLGFLVYYNEHRPHSTLGGLTPKEFIQNSKCVNINYWDYTARTKHKIR